MKTLSIPVLISVIGACVIGYGYWLEKNASEILNIEIPAQERLLAQYKSKIDTLEVKVAKAEKIYQDTQKKYDEYWQKKMDEMIIETAVSAIIPSPLSLVRIKEIGVVFDLMESMIETLKLSGKIDEAANAFQNLKTLQGYLKQYQSLKKELEQKKKLLIATEERIRQLKKIAIQKAERASMAKKIGAVVFGIGVLGTIFVVLLI